MWCVQTIDAEYRERMYNVLDLYEEPYDPKNPLVCFDEKPKQLIGDKRISIPMKPGSPEKYDYEYVRNGTANIFISTLETQKTAAAIRLFHKSQNTEDRIYPTTAISRPLETCPISHLFHIVWVRFQLHIVPQHPDFQESEYLGQLVLQVAILFLCGLHHEIFMPSLRDLCV